MTYKIFSTYYGESYGELVKAYPTLSADFGVRSVDSRTTHIFIDSLAHIEFLREKLMENNSKVFAGHRVTGLILSVDDKVPTIEIYDGYRE